MLLQSISMLVQGYTEVRYDEERKRVVYEPLQLTQAFRFVRFSPVPCYYQTDPSCFQLYNTATSKPSLHGNKSAVEPSLTDQTSSSPSRRPNLPRSRRSRYLAAQLYLFAGGNRDHNYHAFLCLAREGYITSFSTTFMVRVHIRHKKLPSTHPSVNHPSKIKALKSIKTTRTILPQASSADGSALSSIGCVTSALLSFFPHPILATMYSCPTTSTPTLNDSATRSSTQS